MRELVRVGVLRGLSAEFQVTRERWSGSERTVEAAVLHGLAVVDRGAYAGATVDEAREHAAAVFEHHATCARQDPAWPFL